MKRGLIPERLRALRVSGAVLAPDPGDDFQVLASRVITGCELKHGRA